MFWRYAFLIVSCLVLLTKQGMAQSFGGNPLQEIYKQLGLSTEISYSADMEIESDIPGAKGLISKIYFKNGHLRTEGKQGDFSFITILKADGTLFSFNPAMQAWLKSDLSHMASTNQVPEYKKGQEEMMMGKPATRYDFSDGESGVKGSVWVSEGVIVKNESVTPQGKVTVIYKNQQVKDLKDQLFSPPEGTKVQDMNAFLGG